VLSPNASAVGASGAIFALFGAWLAASYRNRRTLQGRANLQQLLLLLGLNLAISFMPGIAWEAHLGGLIAGFAVMMAWLPLAERDDPGRMRTLAAAVPGVLALAAVLVL
jgi:membrane associated rhomboid family serine protease